MDSRRFDAIVRSAATPATRRSALGALVAGGVLGAFGVGRAEAAPVASQGQGGLCVLIFVATVRQGPSASRPLVAGGAPGELRGTMRFSLSGSGNLQNADLLLDDGSSLPVVGQATGHGFQVRIDFGQGRALVAVGVGEQDVSRCLGPLDGPATGPEVGDLGEWHAAAGVQNLPNGGGEAGDRGGGRGGSSDDARTGRSGNRPADGSTGGGNRQSGGGSTEGGNRQSSGGAGGGGSRPSGSGSTSEGSTGGSGRACPAGQTFCDLEEGYCADLQTDPLNCGECGLLCSGELGAGACIGGACGCSPGTTRCDDVCVNTDRDPLNCGGCGTECTGDEECVNGACAADETDCLEGQTRCGDACVDTTSDAGNCSACGLACDASEACSGSLCVPIGGGGGCRTGLTSCGPTCADLQTDAANCGACGGACPAGEACVGGECAPGAIAGQTAGCPEGQLLCGDVCRDALPNFGSDGLSCSGGGAPPTTCPAGRILCNGACFPEGACQPTDCAPGWGYCYGVCRDFENDPGYCGGCSTGCTGGAYCAAGQCVYCAEGLTPCGAACVDTRTDLNNCGGCGERCGTQCLNGQCTAVGPSPLEVTPACANAGTSCADLPCCPGHRCVYGTCYAESGTGEYRCGREFGSPNDCGGFCVYLLTDRNFCGDCGTRCPVGSECRNGNCTFTSAAASAGQTLAPTDVEPQPEPEPVDIEPEPTDIEPEPEPEPELEPPVFSCPEGQVECGGVCTDLSFDPFNCGGCGVACGSGFLCDFGVCGAPPAAAPAPEDEATTCVATGGACDPASSGACCSGACNDDGACA